MTTSLKLISVILFAVLPVGAKLMLGIAFVRAVMLLMICYIAMFSGLIIIIGILEIFKPSA